LTYFPKIAKLSIRMPLHSLTKFTLLISLFCLIIYKLALPAFAAGAVLSLSPVSQTVNTGDTLSTTIYLNTGGELINRVLAKINYPANILTPQSVDAAGSFVTLWYQQSTTNPGSIILEGGVSGSGTTGSQATFVKLNFTTKEAGSAILTFASDSAVYRESDATNILTETQSVTYTIAAVTSTPTPPVTPGISGTPLPTSPFSSITPSPTHLPSSGTVEPTLIFLLGVVLLTIVGFFVLKKT
jgi:hypothetical protein